MISSALKSCFLISICAVAEGYVVRSPILQSPRPTISTGRIVPRQQQLAQPYTRRPTLLSVIPYEQLLEKLPSKAVIDAVADAKSEKVVAADVATRAGVSLSQARKDLTALASLSQGDISVSNDGELIYEFPSDLSGVLSSNSAKYKALQVFEKVWPSIFWAVRVSFGVALLASVVLIFSAILFVNTSSSDDRDDRRSDSRGGGFGGGMGIWGPSPFDFFYYRPYGYYGYYGDNERERDPSKMGFLESVFSYIFGDGNPNQDIEEKRLGLAAQMIRDNNGAVTAEQLAPYCDAPDPDERASAYVDESFVLPIVTQLGGEPQVTDDGDIVYTFPELQVSASTKSIVSKASESSIILKRAGLQPNASTREIKQLLYLNGINTQGALEKKDLVAILEKALPPMTAEEEEEMVQDDPSALMEREYKFSLAPDLYKFFAGGLGIVNLGGVLYLANIMGQYAAYNIELPGILGVTQSLYPLLFAYAILFNAIPLVRNFWIGSQNQKIQQRNQARRKWRARLEARAGNISRKLRAAAKFATGKKQLNSQDVVFDTKDSASKLKESKEKNDLDEFDKLLNDDSSFQ